MSLLFDTIKLTGSLANVREALVAALRAKGFPIKSDASLCEIVDTINSGAVDYCGFVRCLVADDTLYFPDKVEITLDIRSTYHIYENMIASDVARLVALKLLPRDVKWNVIVNDYIAARKQTKRYYDLGIDTTGPITDMYTYSIAHRTSDGRVYFRNEQEQDIIVQDNVMWQVFDSYDAGDVYGELLRSGN
jgi:hypothetical protein